MRDLLSTRTDAGLPDPSAIRARCFVDATNTVVVAVEEKRAWSPALRTWLYSRQANESRYSKLFGPDDRTDVDSFAIAQRAGRVFVLVRKLSDDGLAANLPEVVCIETPHGVPRVVIAEEAIRGRWVRELLHASEDGTTLTAVLGARHDAMDVERDIAYVAQYAIARIRLQDLAVTDLAELPGMFF